MNKNFHENRKNNKISSNLNKCLIPSIFSRFDMGEKSYQKDKLYVKLFKNRILLPDYKNLKKEIIEVKTKFRNLFDIKNTVFKEMITKQNSTTYQNFIRGFGKLYFGPFGIVTKKNKILKEFYLRDALNDKIFAGKLDYYDKDYIINFDKYQQDLKETKKKILSLSQNYAIVTEKDDLYSLKAITSKRLYNRKKNFVSLNRQRYKGYRSFLTEIDETPEKQKKIKNLNYTSKINHQTKTRNIRSSMTTFLKQSIKSPLFLKTSNNFSRNMNKFGNFTKSIYDLKGKKNKIIYRPNNIKKFPIDSYTHFNVSNKNSNKNMNNTNSTNISSSIFFTQTQTSSFNNNKFKTKNIKFNRINNIKRKKLSLNRLNKQIALKNISFNV
jgi:hypothetical protein